MNGSLVNEQYVSKYCLHPDLARKFPVVPKDHVFVLGDNRPNSWDSRWWPGGHFLPLNKISGKLKVSYGQLKDQV